jgi:MFS transporter, MHS family, shikimate and dehydroshikimate transport protein
MQQPAPASMRQIAFGSAFGTALEYYDFIIYGTAAALVFGKLFFPASSPTAGTLASFATLAVGFISRPLGGLLFGHLGDRIGRKPVMIVTLFLMGIASIGMGVMPGYDTIGVLAPVLLVVLRIIQGIAVGGEASGGQLLIIEHAPSRQRAFYASLAQAASPVGSVLSGGLMLIFSAALPQAEFLSWGWRIPFLLSILVVLIGVFVRLHVSESPAFQELKSRDTLASSPITTLLRRHPGKVIVSTLIFGTSISYYLNSVYAITYARDRGLSATAMLAILTIVLFAAMWAQPLAGMAADRYGRKPVMTAGVVLSVVSMTFYFRVLNTANPVLIAVAMFIVAVGFNIYWAVQGAFVAEQFGVRVRYSAMAISSSVGTIIFGGIAPFIATALLSAFHESPWPIAVYAVVGQLISLGATLALKEHRGDLIDDISATAPAGLVQEGTA